MSAAYISSPISPITNGLNQLALFSENTNDRNANSRPPSGPDLIESQPVVESWESLGEDDVWRIIQTMLAILASKQDQKPNHPIKPEWRAPVAKGPDPTKSSQLRAPRSKQRRSSNDRRYVDGPLHNRRYFVVFPCVYFIDQDRVIYRVDERFQHHRVTVQPLQPQIPFNIQGMTYWIDSRGDLSYQLGHEWVKEVFYAELAQALYEVKRCIETNNLQGTTNGLWIHTTSSDESLGNTGTSSNPSSPTLSIGSDEGHALPQLSQCPDQSEIDNWFQQLKRCRAIQAKAGHRLQEVRCPVCGKVQRRPQALRDHLYFHFGIKPYKCQFGCQQAFETKANMERHTDTCPIRWGTQ